MNEANVIHVQTMYAAFARGDLEAIVAACTPDTVWEAVGTPGDFATFGVWTGHQGVRDFFAALVTAATITEFAPRTFHASGDKVFVEGHEKSTLKSGGATDTEWLQVFTFRGGLVAGFREFYDTAQYTRAA